ncbi:MULTISPECIES: glycoside hydrolase family 5 protein [Pseudomonas]|uniref:glycoside hydrolase family 5 protein n=1 Tax=Pseudomonas TaxID=286 RepID=UPI00249C0B30|nr:MULTISPECIES: glycoside hydrolase family 5 protein [Pseudomonas]
MNATTHTFHTLKRVLPLAALLIGSTVQAQEKLPLVSINIAGAEFSSGAIPGKNGTNYFFPDKTYFAKWKERGITLVRFPLKWERLQPKLYGPLDPAYTKLLDDMLAQANVYGVKVILDIHNYARYNNEVIGSAKVTFSDFRKLGELIGNRYKNNPAVYGYDIMNEPYGDADKYWPQAAQAGINGIRVYDKKKPLFVEGRSYSGAYTWPWYNDPMAALTDPKANNIIYSAHAYIDDNGSGQYKTAPANFDPMIGVKRIEPFVAWLKKHGKKGHIGEFGIPNDDPRYLQAMDNTLAYLQKNCITMTYWAAGPSWGTYKLSVEPTKTGQDKAQWAILKKYINGGNCTKPGPN